MDTKYKQALEHYLNRTGAKGFKVRAALVDMDGVLYDSMPGHARAWHRMTTELGINCTVDEFFLYEGMTGKATINVLYQRAYGKEATEEEVKQLYAKKAEYFRNQGTPKMMPGASEMLNTLVENGIKRVLVTGSGQINILSKVDADYPGIFTECEKVTGLNTKIGKPNPEPYLVGLQHAGVQANEAIVIENAPLGVQAGVAAGCFTIAITTGPIPKEEMIKSGADIIFDSMPQFAAEINDLLKCLN